jgi:cytochrome oxidase Cu insertion factor (SCO1/SenC/PrrC family)
MRWTVMAASAAGLLAGIIAALTLFPETVERLVPDRKTITVGKASIGGPFKLTNQDGEPVTERSYKGDYLLVFFGFTYCPDICPAALQVVSQAMEKLGPKAKRLRPLFISVDHERDTPEQLKLYMSNFHPRIVGLTGSAEQIDAAAKAYRAYYRKVKDPSLTDEYTMDHSAFLYLMSPDGEFITHFTHVTPVDKLVARLATEIR